MKKLTALILVFLISTPMLASCSLPHDHEYREEWSADLEYHWHFCDKEGCTEVADKTPHVWDDGITVAEPTTTLDGLKKFTCTECGAIRTEVYKYGES